MSSHPVTFEANTAVGRFVKVTCKIGRPGPQNDRPEYDQLRDRRSLDLGTLGSNDFHGFVRSERPRELSSYTRFFSSCILSPSPRISFVRTSKLAGVPASRVFSPLTIDS